MCKPFRFLLLVNLNSSLISNFSFQCLVVIVSLSFVHFEIQVTLLLIMTGNLTEESEIQDTFLQEAQSYLTYKIVKYTDRYWFPILLPLGLIGNTASFLVMIRSNNRKVLTCIYMAAISINDNLMLFCVLHDFLHVVSAMNIQKWYLLECKINTFFAFFCLQCATYLVLSMTLDKYIAIKWPHRAATYSTPRRAKIIIVTITCLVLMYNLPHFFITNIVEGKCYGYSVKSNLTKIYSWSTFIINGVFPFIFLIHMNYIIVRTVRKSHRMFTNSIHATGMMTRQKTMKSAENQLTTMLLLITTLFLILLFPTYIRFIYAAFVISDTPYKYATSLFIFEISYKLYVTNSGINFFLYCVSGQKFRNDLKETVCCKRRTGSSSNVSHIDANTSSNIL